MAMETPLLSNGNKSGNGDLKNGSLIREFGWESKRLWKLAGPAIFTALCQYSLGALTQTFAGLLGEIELAAVSIENSVIAGLGFGVMLGMGSALETLCGQAYGAGRLRMLGVYMQRSWVILLTTAFLLVPIYVFAPPTLEFIGVTTEISEAAGKFALWMLPQLFAYALNFPIQKFLQAQSKVMVMAWISAAVLVIHALFSWLLIFNLGYGLVGAAVMLNTSWWLIIIAQLLYIFTTKSDGAWSGFSWLAFSDLSGFVKLSLSSALGVLVLDDVGGDHGAAPQPSYPGRIHLDLHELTRMGCNDCTRIQCCNQREGIERARSRQSGKFAVVVVSVTSVTIGVICMSVVFATRDIFPYLFTSSPSVAAETTKLAVLLGITVLLTQPPACPIRCCGWSGLAVSRGVYQHRVLLHPWVAGRYHPRFRIGLWCNGYMVRNDRRHLPADLDLDHRHLHNQLEARSGRSRRPSEEVGKISLRPLITPKPLAMITTQWKIPAEVAFHFADS
ncbi:hypothetical protein SAY86_015876 [Trapa natans]|uniref:Protein DETOXIFICATION n=1 Tax=Trapa natans TaxID=22666 RepID=A0AAN7LAM7_TRANT|nr:hypothetical protein SAY86_015542 [Trapa natans]KAK4781774.1 hypothetical protein SAY86_015876 [Trapa natans]